MVKLSLSLGRPDLQPSLRTAVFGVALVSSFSTAWADAVRDCVQAADPDLSISGCTEVIDKRLVKGTNLAIAYVDRAYAYLRKGDYDNAIADADQAIRIDPKFANTYGVLANIYYSKQDYDRAMGYSEQALGLDPKFVPALVVQGKVYTGKGDYDRAIATFDRATQINPKDSYAYADRGEVYAARGDYDRAIVDYDQAIRFDPKSPEPYVMRGDMYYFKGDLQSAAADFLKATDLGDEPYGMLFRFIVRGRMGQDGTSELSANAQRLKNKDWPYPVIDFYLGRRSLDEMRAAADTSAYQCEAAVFAGEWQLLHDNKIEGKTELQKANDLCSSKGQVLMKTVIAGELSKL